MTPRLDSMSRFELLLHESWSRAASVRTVDAPCPAGGVAEGIGSAREALTALVDAPLWALDGAATGDLILDLERLTAQASALQSRLLAQAVRGAGDWGGGAPTWTSRTDLVGWLAESLPVTRSEATRRILLAQSLETSEHLARAFDEGRVSRDQAGVIVEAVQNVPAAAVVRRDDRSGDGESGDARERAARTLAELHLTEAAATWHVPALRRLGRGILEVIDPEGADAREADRIQRDEARAAERCSLSMARDAQGSWVGRFVLPDLAGAMLHKALTAIANPAREPATEATTGETGRRGRTASLRLSEAFCEYVERFPAKALPAAAGGSATVVVTTTLEDLRGGLDARTARLDTGDLLSAGETRRLACTSGVVPVVLGGPSQPLDLGRERRLHSTSQRLALAVRDGGCRADGCDWPPGMCHAHHLRPWPQGGPTTVADGILLCPRHHRQAHKPGLEMRLDHERRATFHARSSRAG